MIVRWTLRWKVVAGRDSRLASPLVCTVLRARGVGGLDDAVLFWVEVPVVSQDSGASRHGQITTTTSQAKPLGPKPDAFCQLSTKFAEFVS